MTVAGGLAVLFGLAAALAVYFSPLVHRAIATRALRKYVTDNRILVLSYDDGPSGEVTPKLLDLLSAHEAKATFFMLGRSAQNFPDVADRVVAEGHDAACHTDAHLNAWKVSPWRALADIDAGYARLSRWVGARGAFRPPYGKMTLPTYLSLRRRGAPFWWWTIVSGDTAATLPDPQSVADQVARAGGGVVLLHDLDRAGERNDFVLSATAMLLGLAQRERFTIKTLRELTT